MADTSKNKKSKQIGVKFDQLKLNEWLIKQLKLFGIERSTPIQENCIPAILSGKDCIGCAKTGSGKTLAFALPILQKLCQDPYGIFALILTPTRELAIQITEQFRVLGKAINLTSSLIIGGLEMIKQGKELAKLPHVVVATPGRLADHLNTCDTFSLSRLKFLVLDEADRLLDGQFNEPLKTILGAVPTERQTLLFSATLSETFDVVRKLAKNDVFTWHSDEVTVTVDELDQRYVLVPSLVKDGYLVRVICQFREEHPDWSIVVFTNTCKSCQVCSMMLRDLGFECIALHSMISQRERMAALAKFKSNIVRVLLATDVASRGLDIPQVNLVINQQVPIQAKDYVHRVGRTARAGREGMAISLVTQKEIHLIQEIEKYTRVKLKELKVDDEEVLKLLTQVAMAKRQSEIRLDEMEFGENRIINKRKQMILEGKDPDEMKNRKGRKRKWKS